VAVAVWVGEPTEGYSSSASGVPPLPMVVGTITQGPSEVR
jgi:hypothetical protein